MALEYNLQEKPKRGRPGDLEENNQQRGD